MRLKKIQKYRFSIVGALMICVQLGALATPVFSEEVDTTLSEWAEVEVKEAIDKEMVPEVLQADYKASMKRYEYVLLALEILEQEYVQTRIVRYIPFEDTYNHEYKDEIRLAYNAGIINGDGNGKFRPDDTITREEIAILLTNLIRVMQEEFKPVTGRFFYADDGLVHDWAKTSVDYCYAQGIIKGVGTIDSMPQISPDTNATREQAMIMMLRVGDVIDLFRTYDYPELRVENYDGSGKRSSDGLNTIARTMGESIADLVLEISKEPDVIIYQLDAELVEIRLLESLIMIQKDASQTKVDYLTNNLNDDQGNQLLEVVGTLFYGDNLETPLNRAYIELPVLEDRTMTLGITDYADIILNTNDLVNYNYQIQLIESYE